MTVSCEYPQDKNPLVNGRVPPGPRERPMAQSVERLGISSGNYCILDYVPIGYVVTEIIQVSIDANGYSLLFDSFNAHYRCNTTHVVVLAFTLEPVLIPGQHRNSFLDCAVELDSYLLRLKRMVRCE